MSNVANKLTSSTVFKNEYQGQLYVRYSTKKGVKYLRCIVNDCLRRATLNNEVIAKEYDIDDYLQESTPTASASASLSDQPVLNTDKLCDTCWTEARAKVVFVPCGHSRFYQACADRCSGSVDRKCALCRTRIELVMPIFT
jgi:Zinc finger, C3HC4 type (RING finger)